MDNTTTMQSPAPRKKRNQNWLMKSTDKLLETFEASALEPSTTQISSMGAFHHVCSYNWRKARPATILVPGLPNEWAPVALPVTLQANVGLYDLDQNSARSPKFAFEPLFRAISLEAPDLSFTDVQLVANRNSLRKLFDYASGHKASSFRIDLQMVGNTLFFIRKERSATRLLGGGGDNAGYGHSFEASFTVPERRLRNASGHHRAIRYKLGDMDCIVQFEVDAFSQEVSLDQRVQVLPRTSTSRSATTSALAPLPLRSTDSRPTMTASNATLPAHKPILTVRRGRFIRPAQLVELKSHSARTDPAKSRSSKQYMAQLWFGRIPHLKIAKHRNGVVDKIKHVNAVEKFPEWEEEKQNELQTMLGLIHRIRNTVLNSEGTTFALVYENKVKPMKLELYSTFLTRKVLPEDILARHWV